MAGAKDGVAILEEFKAAGFIGTEILRRFRNARTKNPKVIAAELVAHKER